jgi:superfamily II DNA or RNA helicase
MSVLSRFEKSVPAAIRSRGLSYYQARRIRLFDDAGELTIHAQVAGNSLYDVSVTCQERELLVSCTCPYFFGEESVCKHIWSVLVTADRRGKFDHPPFASIQQLRCDPSRLALFAEDAFPEAEPPLDRRGASDGEETFDEDGEGLDDDDLDLEPRPVFSLPPVGRDLPASVEPASRLSREPRPPWRRRIESSLGKVPIRASIEDRSGDEQIVYLFGTDTDYRGELIVEIASRRPSKSGGWLPLRQARLTEEELAGLPDPIDRQILSLVRGIRSVDAGYGTFRTGRELVPRRFAIPPAAEGTLVPMICGTGRALLRQGPTDPELIPITWDGGDPWLFRIEVSDGGRGWRVDGLFERSEERRSSTEALFASPGGTVLFLDRIARFEPAGAHAFVEDLRKQGAVPVPRGEAEQMVELLVSLPGAPLVSFPHEIRWEERSIAPRPALLIRRPPPASARLWGEGAQNAEWLRGELVFDYEDRAVPGTSGSGAVVWPEERRFARRRFATERLAAKKLRGLALRTMISSTERGEERWGIPPRRLPEIVRALLAEGWRVEAEGASWRAAGAFRIEVSSGLDWLDLHGGIDFDGIEVPLPEILAAIRRKESFVKLGDGGLGLLPEQWLKRWAPLVELGQAEQEAVRFRPSQAALLDALLSEVPEAKWDEKFEELRTRLRSFAGIRPVEPAPGFTGTLRDYQKEGLGWLRFLEEMGLGGCLADDMGLGKTVQVLAHLDLRRVARGRRKGKPSLVVVPRSLVFNWKAEAARFVPELRVLDYSGPDRAEGTSVFGKNDVVLTTYGILRQEIARLRDFGFDYAILDEAQAIKNRDSQAARAARLLLADHRLALSGTPIENHLGELWSLFEFLDPGLLGRATIFGLGRGGGRSLDAESRDLLARALRPFILRRTKEQVARDLPERSEQTLFCELEPAQREVYDELRRHFRTALAGRIAREGMGKARMQVLEALLRLRQAACHPALLDARRKAAPSAKLETLLPMIEEIVEEGHKALVFSQFTSFLALVRSRLDEAKIPYEYLDGSTRDREARVEAFQGSEGGRVFLISLKAGGLGLNLTAAEYVFLLDPWWNPAVEAQAIDRAHRIGQTQQVFAYRLVARDTVEEKILELQQSKRDLADAIIREDDRPIADLTREDLDLLLS